jgi:hypothetical protein
MLALHGKVLDQMRTDFICDCDAATGMRFHAWFVVAKACLLCSRCSKPADLAHNNCEQAHAVGQPRQVCGATKTFHL